MLLVDNKNRLIEKNRLIYKTVQYYLKPFI